MKFSVPITCQSNGRSTSVWYKLSSSAFRHYRAYKKFIPIISDGKSEKPSTASQQRPLDQGSTLNQAADSVEAIKAFEITIDSLTGDYRDGHFVCRNGPNMDVAMKIKEQIASNMRVFQVSLKT